MVLKDIKAPVISSLIQFIYHGATDVPQEQLNDFLDAAQALEIKGLADEEGQLPPPPPATTRASNKPPPPHRQDYGPPVKRPKFSQSSYQQQHQSDGRHGYGEERMTYTPTRGAHRGNAKMAHMSPRTMISAERARGLVNSFPPRNVQPSFQAPHPQPPRHVSHSPSPVRHGAVTVQPVSSGARTIMRETLQHGSEVMGKLKSGELTITPANENKMQKIPVAKPATPTMPEERSGEDSRDGENEMQDVKIKEEVVDEEYEDKSGQTAENETNKQENNENDQEEMGEGKILRK